MNHIHHRDVDCGVYPDGRPLFESYKVVMISNLQSTSGTGARPRNIALFRKALAPYADPSTGVWNLIKMWQEGADYDDSSASGSVDVFPNGTVHITMSFGRRNSEGHMTYQSWEATVYRGTFAPRIVRKSEYAGFAAGFDVDFGDLPPIE